MGAFLALVNRISPFTIKRDPHQCTDCGLCDKACPAGIEVSSSRVVDKTECISCGECIEVCPKKKVLVPQITIGSLHWILSNKAILIIVIVVFFGGIGLTKATGLYRSKNYSIAELKNKKDLVPEDIKGYMSLREVADVFKLNIGDLYTVLKLDETLVSPDVKCKEIGTLIGKPFETDDVRIGVGTLLNIPEDQIQRSCSTGGADQSGFFIPGTMTLQQVCTTYAISPQELYREMRLRENQVPLSTPCRDLRVLVHPSFHTTVVREAVTKILERRK
jgi:ferredoxin